MKNNQNNIIRELLAKKFPGDIDQARLYMEELDVIRRSINSMTNISGIATNKDDWRKLTKCLVESFATLVSEIEIPIVSKYPELKPTYVKEANTVN